MKKFVRAKKECMEKLEEAVLNNDLVEGEVRDDSPLAKAVRMATKAQAKAKSAVEHITSQIFQLHSNFLSEEARQPWNKILAEQIDSGPWKDLRGIVHNTPRSKMWHLFQGVCHIPHAHSFP
jgi:chemotaxis regulatin CheY-phosphate phosphatase CheZ